MKKLANGRDETPTSPWAQNRRRGEVGKYINNEYRIGAARRDATIKGYGGARWGSRAGGGEGEGEGKW